MDIKVSIFCSTYNHSDYIRSCLTGFLTQFFSFEVLIRDIIPRTLSSFVFYDSIN
jgi:glycosyltransferase involved in cell wall biosynthesis